MSAAPPVSDPWNASLYQNQHAFVWEYGQDLLSLLQAKAGERILDLGCGAGQLTALIHRQGAVAIGLDSSPRMIAQAQENFPTLDFRLADAAAFTLEAPVDAVFSNAALHWIQQPEAALEQIYQALKPGGRFVAELGGKGNIQTIRHTLAALLAKRHYDLPHPWYFPSLGEYTFLLEQKGFRVTYAVLFERPTPLEQGERGLFNWLTLFAPVWLATLPPAEQEQLYWQATEILRPQLYRGGIWWADYCRLRISALKPKSEA